MERMAPVNLATGKGLGAKFNETYFAHYKDAIDHITVKKKAYALIDPHNYMVRVYLESQASIILSTPHHSVTTTLQLSLSPEV